jgi:arylsulfatase
MGLLILFVLLESTGIDKSVRAQEVGVADDDRPSILLIMADDMGYTDMGSFGGEIRTPNLDELAFAGVRLTNFHAGPACAQTRSMLMSGTYTHVALDGGDNPRAGGILRDSVLAFPRLMQEAGYHTYMSGKWHVGKTPEQSPVAHGFDSSFAFMGGGDVHFRKDVSSDGMYLEHGENVELPEDFYATEYYTDKMLEYLRSNEGDGKPFFAWYTPTSPHWPLQAPDDYIDLYAGDYDAGYDAVIDARLARAADVGALPAGISMENYPRSGQWSELSADERRLESRKMEVYAAMVEHLDDQVGRLINYLKASGQFDNTYIIFMSDNGGDASVRPEREGVDNSLENIGRASSYVALGPWGDVVTAPFKWNKGRFNEGGIRVPAFAYHRNLLHSGTTDDQFLTVLDVTPTFLELAGFEHPGNEYHGKPVFQPRGISFLNLLRGNSTPAHGDDIAAGWFQSALYVDEWKLFNAARRGPADWELYNIIEDPSETSNLAGNNAALVQELASDWTRIAEETGFQ